MDLDGVLAEFPESLADVDSTIAEACKRWCEATGEHHSDFEGLFATIQPKEGASEAIRRLMLKFDVYVLTSAPWKNISSWSDKRIWVEKFLPELPRRKLILTHDKSLNRGAYLIDDRTNNGALEFDDYEGQELILFGAEKYPDWESVLEYLNC